MILNMKTRMSGILMYIYT